MSTSQDSNGVSNCNSELQHFKYKLPRLFLVFLRWAGFVEESDRNFKSKFIWIFFYVLQLLASAFMVTVVFLQRQVLEKQLVSITSLACNQAICVVHFIWVTCVFWSAGSVPVALNKLNRFFYRKAHSRLLHVRTSEGRKLKRELFEKPEFVLTGCDVIAYRRSSILAFVGTLLTYSIITMDIKDKNH
ncbi:uncharacterized protein CEXT_8021 [Caerostris extrusa]|uniref:Gustatory receptor n=1 Tax=Caerostris extrusa TaxID=172846 RepID=A0AAV4YEM7_CAEEX|nr:uncharacterized protein CEXT_8021 [Caerostris extrusa]